MPAEFLPVEHRNHLPRVFRPRGGKVTAASHSFLRTVQEENPGASECDLKWIALELRWKIAEQGGIPKWDGTRLLDASGRVCGRRDLEPAIRVLLAKLNYWERAYGMSSIPPGYRGKTLSTGEERAAMARYIEALRDKGIPVALDADEGLWKVLDDGAN